MIRKVKNCWFKIVANVELIDSIPCIPDMLIGKQNMIVEIDSGLCANIISIRKKQILWPQRKIYKTKTVLHTTDGKHLSVKGTTFLNCPLDIIPELHYLVNSNFKYIMFGRTGIISFCPNWRKTSGSILLNLAPM